MMEFIMLTVSITLGILLASAIAMVILLNPKVLKAYTKYYMKVVEKISKSLLEDEKEEI